MYQDQGDSCEEQGAQQPFVSESFSCLSVDGNTIQLTANDCQKNIQSPKL